MTLHYLDLSKEYINRFDLAKFLNFNNGSFDVLTSYFLYQLKKIPPKEVRTVTIEEFNPEMMSARVYGDPQYEWIIMFYNNLTDINEFVAGLEIALPSVTDLEKLFFTLVSKEKTKATKVTQNTNLIVTLDGNLTITNGSNTNTVVANKEDKNFVYNFTETEIVSITHNLNKRPAVQAFEFSLEDDGEGNEIEVEKEIGKVCAYPKNFETTKVIVYFDQPRTGVIVLN